MTHDELLDCVKPEYAYGKIGDALRAVVQLHKPIDAAEGLSQASRDILGYTNVCDECHYDGGPYPCDTIKAIEKELK